MEAKGVRPANMAELNKEQAQVAQAHYERSAYINLFHFAYIMTSAKNKSLYEKCSKYVLTAINAK